jgi:microcystin-dependent protein
MADPFLAEIRIMSFVFPPKGWALADGQFLPINQNQPLFALLGTTFGGNGQTTFALPDLRGRVPIHVGSGHTLGERGGEAAHTISISEMPTHTHLVSASATNANQPIPAGALVGSANNAYTAAANLTSLDPSTITNIGGSQAHSNTQPFLTLSFCIALQGIFPSQS